MKPPPSLSGILPCIPIKTQSQTTTDINLRKSQHTPGPWRAEWLNEENAWVMDKDGNYLATLVVEDEEGKCATGDQQIFNLELMAAAPDLLASLQAMVNVFCTQIETDTQRRVVETAIKLIEGEQ